MTHRFNKHYTREEARALLPELRQWLGRLDESRVELEKNERRLTGLMATGQDLGGAMVNKSARIEADVRDLLRKFQDREIFIKDLQRGLLDFPALIGGKEVFLCWEKDEEDVTFWHDIDSGYANREPL